MACQMQIEVAANPGKYLGIPSFWGKSKSATMGYIKERIIQKLQGWKSCLLSQGGREVLIKAVACAIPIYTMQYFKIPKKVCGEVNARMVSFWWGQKREERKVHWVS